MNLFVNQSIVIKNFKVGGLSNSSVLQIGSAGIIKSYSELANTGAYTAPAPEAKAEGIEKYEPGEVGEPKFVPLQPPTASA